MTLEKAIASLPKWEDTEKELYKDKEFALLRLQTEVKEFNKTGEIKYLLSTINDIIKYSDLNITDITRATKISRPTIYSIIKNDCNPKINTLQTILKELGYKLKLEPVNKKRMA